jgi:hypothetical protein
VEGVLEAAHGFVLLHQPEVEAEDADGQESGEHHAPTLANTLLQNSYRTGVEKVIKQTA